MLEAQALTVARGRRVLLDGLSLRAEPGDILHVAGPNGSGKSSLLRVLAGVVEPRHGRVLRGAPARYVPERVALPDALPAARWLRLFGAAGDERGPVRQRSKGQLQRLVLTAALAGEAPRVLVLDEPWAGLDADMRSTLSGELAAAARAGSVLVVTDHTGAVPAAAQRLELR